MTTDDETPPRARLPKQKPVRALEPGCLVCMDCGSEVRPPYQAETLEAGGYVGLTPAREPILHDVPQVFTMSRCEVCRERRARAVALLAQYPRIRHSLGSRSFALGIVDATLCAFDALGVKESDIDRLLASERDVRLAIETLKVAGTAARWCSAFLPIRLVNANPNSCASGRWTAISNDDRQRLIDSYAALLAARIDKGRKVAPPDDGLRGCLQCGVGAVSALLAEVPNIWGERRRVSPRALGGRGAEYIDGYVCPDCAPIVDSSGFGPTSIERSIVKLLGIRRSIDDPELVGVPAWGSLPKGTPPNAQPWDHVDLDAVVDALEAAPRRTVDHGLAILHPSDPLPRRTRVGAESTR